MNYRLENRDILYNSAQLGPYPNELLKRVDHITTETPGPIHHFHQSDNIKAQVIKGGFGEVLAKSYNESLEVIHNHIERFPVSAALTKVCLTSQFAWRKNNFPVSDEIAPIPNDPRVLSRHIKCLAHFLGAQQVGICEIPDGACYLDGPDGTPFDSSHCTARTQARTYNRRLHRSGLDLRQLQSSNLSGIGYLEQHHRKLSAPFRF